MNTESGIEFNPPQIRAYYQARIPKASLSGREWRMPRSAARRIAAEIRAKRRQ
jgi:hypothetical protein